MGAVNNQFYSIGLAGWKILYPCAWQASLLAVSVLLITLAWRRGPACVKHGLWLIVLLKFALPLPMPFPTAALNPVRYVRPPLPVTTETTETNRPYWLEPYWSDQFWFDRDPSTNTIELGFPRPFYSRLTAWIALIWMMTAMSILVFRLSRYRRTRRLMLRMGTPASTAVQSMAAETAREIGLARLPRLLEIPDLPSPLVLGFLSPIVLIPTSDSSELNRGECRALLAHELQHLRRRDHWVLPLELFALTLHWFNPLAWMAVRQLRAERERATDDAVVAMQGDIEKDYVSGLVKIARMQNTRALNASGGAGALALFETRGDLAARVKRMMIPSRRIVPRLGRFGAAAMLTLACVALAKAPEESARKAVAIRASEPFDVVNYVRESQEVRNVTGEIRDAKLLPAVDQSSGHSMWGSSVVTLAREVLVKGEKGEFAVAVESREKKSLLGASRTAHILKISPRDFEETRFESALRTLTADRVEKKENGAVTALGQVKFNFESENHDFEVTADHVDFDPKLQTIQASGKFALTVRDQQDKIQAVINNDKNKAKDIILLDFASGNMKLGTLSPAQPGETPQLHNPGSPEPMPTLTLDAQGQLNLENRNLAEGELRPELKALAGKGVRHLRLRVDKNVSRRRVIELMDLCREAGISEIIEDIMPDKLSEDLSNVFGPNFVKLESAEFTNMPDGKVVMTGHVRLVCKEYELSAEKLTTALP